MRQSQWDDDTAVGRPKPFYCHNTLPTTGYQLISQPSFHFLNKNILPYQSACCLPRESSTTLVLTNGEEEALICISMQVRKWFYVTHITLPLPGCVLCPATFCLTAGLSFAHTNSI